MKISFVLPRNLSGGNRVVATYAERLLHRGHDVTVVSIPPRRSLRMRLRSLLHGRGWPPSPRREPSHLDGTRVPERLLNAARPVVDSDVPDGDVVVATWWETAEWVARLSESKGAKVYFIQGHEVFDGMPVARVKATYALPLHKITISKWLVDLMREEYGDPHVAHVPNSVDTALFRAPPRGKQAIPTVGMLYYPGRLKGCDLSLRALALARAALPRIHLVSFGLMKPDPALPLPRDATFVHNPAQHRLRELYARCDVWLCGSRSEGFHLPPLEAMACRCPVVSTRVGGPLDIIEQGRNGWLVDVEDAEGLARRLLDVLGLPDARWRDMSDAALETARRYTWDDATTLFEQALYTAVAAGRPAISASRSRPG